LTARITLGLLLCVAVALLFLALYARTASAVEYVDGRWTDDRGNVWLTDREVWWSPPSSLYYVNGWWRDGAGRYWDAATKLWLTVQSYGANPITLDVVSSHRTSGVERWRDLVASVFPAWAVNDVLAVMACESNGDPWATGAAGERGLMQMRPRYHQWRADLYGGNLYDAETNIRAAHHLWREQGFRPWTCRP
jgi:soluble lytic murein transglycosylase-like protein